MSPELIFDTTQKMAEQLNMGGLSLQDSQHANGGGGGFGAGRSAYVPPHARGGAPTRGPAPAGEPANGGLDGSAWGPNG